MTWLTLTFTWTRWILVLRMVLTLCVILLWTVRVHETWIIGTVLSVISMLEALIGSLWLALTLAVRVRTVMVSHRPLMVAQSVGSVFREWCLASRGSAVRPPRLVDLSY